MPKHLFVYLSGLVLFVAAGTIAFSQEVAPRLKDSRLAPLPSAPEGRILDEGRVFAFDPEIQTELSAKLAKAFENDQLDVYVAAYSFLLNEPIEQRAERLLHAWVTQPRGLVIVYVRGGGQMTFAASEDMDDFLPRMDLEDLFGVAAMSAKQFAEPSKRLKAAVEQTVRLLAEKLQAKSEVQTLLRPDVLFLAAFAILAILVIALAGSAFSRLENRPPTRHRFPPAYVFSRFGASNGGGTVGEVAFGRGTWGYRSRRREPRAIRESVRQAPNAADAVPPLAPHRNDQHEIASEINPSPFTVAREHLRFRREPSTMTYLQAILLGVLQGLTEFLPVSSSGHLVLAGNLLGIGEEGQGVTFELAVHCGTLLSVLIYFRHKLALIAISPFRPELKEERRLIGMIIIGTIPAVFAGLFLKDYFEAAYDKPVLTSAMLCVTGIILFLPYWLKTGANDLKPRSAFLIGVGQAFAILPGISRSGSTIVVGMLAGVQPARAAEFSFLLAIPAIAGASILQAGEMSKVDSGLIGQYIAGSVAAFVLGLVAVYAVLATIRKGKFQYFGYYCLAVGIIGLLYFSFKSS